jgi:hypothetical protein
MKLRLCAAFFMLAVPQIASAAIVKLTFSGTFTGEFSSPLVPTGTAFNGSLDYDSETPPSVVNMFDARYNFSGPLVVKIGDTSYSAPFEAVASKSPFGPEGILFSAQIYDNVLFALRFNNLSGVVYDLRLPGDPAAFPDMANAGISTPQFQGNFGTASVTASSAAVPEPTSWVMLGAGFALAGSALRSRRSLKAT